MAVYETYYLAVNVNIQLNQRMMLLSVLLLLSLIKCLPAGAQRTSNLYHTAGGMTLKLQTVEKQRKFNFMFRNLEQDHLCDIPIIAFLAQRMVTNVQ